ncbi:MAG: hypothetical protein ACK56I_24420, partial [bacterium]
SHHHQGERGEHQAQGRRDRIRRIQRRADPEGSDHRRRQACPEAGESREQDGKRAQQEHGPAQVDHAGDPQRGLGDREGRRQHERGSRRIGRPVVPMRDVAVQEAQRIGQRESLVVEPQGLDEGTGRGERDQDHRHGDRQRRQDALPADDLRRVKLHARARSSARPAQSDRVAPIPAAGRLADAGEDAIARWRLIGHLDHGAGLDLVPEFEEAAARAVS